MNRRQKIILSSLSVALANILGAEFKGRFTRHLLRQAMRQVKMKLMTVIRFGICSIVGVQIISPAIAATVYSDRASFLAATAGLSLSQEGFNAPFDAGNPVDFGDFSVTASAGNVNWGNGASFPEVVSEGAGSIYGFNDNPFSQNTFTFDFSSPITAFGVDINEFSIPPLTASTDTGSLLAFEIADQPPPIGTKTIFFGVVDSTPFSSVSIRWANATDTVGFDDLVYVAPIPIPAAAPLLGSGIGLLGYLGWRKRKQRQSNGWVIMDTHKSTDTSL